MTAKDHQFSDTVPQVTASSPGEPAEIRYDVEVSKFEATSTSDGTGELVVNDVRELNVHRTMTKAHISITIGMLFLNVSPLILLIVAGRWDYRIALGTAELLAIALLFINYALWYYGYCLIKVHTLHIAMVVGFGLLFFLTFAAPKEFYETWFHVIFHFMVFFYVLGGFIINKPFTMDFAKAAYHEDVWHLPVLRRDMRIACIPFIFSFATNATMSVLKETLREELPRHRPAAVFIMLIIPVFMIAIAVVCFGIIRRRLDKKLLALSVEVSAGRLDKSGVQGMAV